MTLREKQVLFARAIADFVRWLDVSGYEVTLDEFYRPPETAALYAQQGRGSKNSLHCDKLAADLNVFHGGVLLNDPASWASIGQRWKSYNNLARWGGDFTSRDYRHFSFTHQGRA